MTSSKQEVPPRRHEQHVTAEKVTGDSVRRLLFWGSEESLSGTVSPGSGPAFWTDMPVFFPSAFRDTLGTDTPSVTLYSGPLSCPKPHAREQKTQFLPQATSIESKSPMLPTGQWGGGFPGADSFEESWEASLNGGYLSSPEQL